MTNTQAWDYAVGMIKVDGLEPTQEFKEYIEKEKRGEVTMADIKQYLDKKYKVKEETVNACRNVRHPKGFRACFVRDAGQALERNGYV